MLYICSHSTCSWLRHMNPINYFRSTICGLVIVPEMRFSLMPKIHSTYYGLNTNGTRIFFPHFFHSGASWRSVKFQESDTMEPK